MEITKKAQSYFHKTQAPNTPLKTLRNTKFKASPKEKFFYSNFCTALQNSLYLK